MKNFKLLFVTLMFIINQIVYRTMKSLKVINPVDDGKNTIPMLTKKNGFFENYFYGGKFKMVFMGNDRSGKKTYGIISSWYPKVITYGEEPNAKMIFLPIVNPNQSIRAALLAPKDKDGRVNLGNSIRTKGANTTWITINPTQLSDLIPLIAAVNNSATEAEMNSAWFKLNKKLRGIMQLVQNCMDNNVDDSAVICALYGFHVAGKGGKQEQIFEGFTGSVTGTVDMLAEVGHAGSAYVWWSWNAARTISTYLKTSTYAHCTIEDQVSNVPLNISCNTIEGEKVVHESQIIAVVPK